MLKLNCVKQIINKKQSSYNQKINDNNKLIMPYRIYMMKFYRRSDTSRINSIAMIQFCIIQLQREGNQYI